MKKTFYIIAVFLGGLLLMTGCRKDELAGGIMLTTETFTPNGTKTAVSGDQVHWVNGDQVRINGQTATVEVSGSDARATGIESLSGAIRAYYPASIITASGAENEGTDNPTVIFPRRFNSSFSGTQQTIGLPMVGRADADATSILMKHISAAINVRIKNSTGRTKLYVDSVVVTSADKQLCGAATVAISSDNNPVVSGSDNMAANRSVSVCFDEPILVNGDYVEVQVPILPIASGNLVFDVYTHALLSDIYPGVTRAHYSYNYSRSLSNGSLGRNVLGVAQIAITSASSYVTEIDRGYFTVSSSGNKVRFSQGNLTYNISTEEWNFLENQYSTVETSNQNVGTNYASQNIISLFGWGTSGWNNGNTYYRPYDTERSDGFSYGYGPTDGSSYLFNLTGTYANSDWGSNAIKNGENTSGLWHTLSSGDYGEMRYLLYARTVVSNTLESTARFTMATIGGVYKGVIIFPDVYTHPTGVDFVAGTYNNKSDYTATVSVAGWKKMEAAGAVFLPAAGYRALNNVFDVGVSCEYWSTTTEAPNQSLAMTLSSITNSCYNGRNKNYGLAVRLVQGVR